MCSVAQNTHVLVLGCQSWKGHLWSRSPVTHLQVEKPAGPSGSQRATKASCPAPPLSGEKRHHTVGVAEPRLEPSRQGSCSGGPHSHPSPQVVSRDRRTKPLASSPRDQCPCCRPTPALLVRDRQRARWLRGPMGGEWGTPRPREHELHPPALPPPPVASPGSFRTSDRDSRRRGDTVARTPDPVVPQQSCATFIPEPEFHHLENGQ